jgi:hypothetical protein
VGLGYIPEEASRNDAAMPYSFPERRMDMSSQRPKKSYRHFLLRMSRIKYTVTGIRRILFGGNLDNSDLLKKNT